MITISFSAILSLRSKLEGQVAGSGRSDLSLADGVTALDLIAEVGLDPADVEAAFVNGKVLPKDTVLRDGDRVSLVPPGTPGPHRYLLGISAPQ